MHDHSRCGRESACIKLGPSRTAPSSCASRTLIGTPPNLIVSGYRRDIIGAPFGMFDFTPVGLSVAGRRRLRRPRRLVARAGPQALRGRGLPGRRLHHRGAGTRGRRGSRHVVARSRGGDRGCQRAGVRSDPAPGAPSGAAPIHARASRGNGGSGCGPAWACREGTARKNYGCCRVGRRFAETSRTAY
jgi:hypothetical protein